MVKFENFEVSADQRRLETIKYQRRMDLRSEFLKHQQNAYAHVKNEGGYLVSTILVLIQTKKKYHIDITLYRKIALGTLLCHMNRFKWNWHFIVHYYYIFDYILVSLSVWSSHTTIYVNACLLYRTFQTYRSILALGNDIHRFTHHFGSRIFPME